MSKWIRAAELAAKQHGVVARRQLTALGIGDTTLSRFAKDRGWTRVHPGVYRLPGHVASFAQTVIAAQLALPIPAVASSTTAARLYGLNSPHGKAEPIHLLVDEHDRLVAPRGVRLTRTRTLRPGDVTELEGVRLATSARMVIDYASTALSPDVRAMIIDACQRRLLQLPTLAARVEDIGPVRGRGMVRQLVWELDEVRRDSVLEGMARQLIEAAGLPPPEPRPVAVNVGRRVVHVDIGWEDRQVGVEVDGFAFHASRAQLERDHRRSNALALAGWTILRVGWGRIERDPEGFIGELGTALSVRWSDPSRIRK